MSITVGDRVRLVSVPPEELQAHFNDAGYHTDKDLAKGNNALLQGRNVTGEIVAISCTASSRYMSDACPYQIQLDESLGFNDLKWFCVINIHPINEKQLKLEVEV